MILNSVLYEGDSSNSLKLFENRKTLIGFTGGQVTGIVGRVARSGDVEMRAAVLLIIPGGTAFGRWKSTKTKQKIVRIERNMTKEK
jgi:hypothetical protein